MDRSHATSFKSSRRLAISSMVEKVVAIGATTAMASCHSFVKSPRLTGNHLRLKGNINPSVCGSTCADLSIGELCKLVKDMGFNCIDLVSREDWPVLRKYGTACTMCISSQMYNGWNHKQNHPSLIQEYSTLIPLVAQAGFKNLMCSCGYRNGMNDETGLINCTDGIKKIIRLAEKNAVMLHMEMLNSKIDHTDYMCDHTEWGVELCKRIGSEHFKLIYDIYHMQVNEGNIIATIKEHSQYIGHYHTGGVPGRHEIDETQELNYKAIMKAIVETGFQGHVAHEFIPLSDNSIASVKNAILICDV